MIILYVILAIIILLILTVLFTKISVIIRLEKPLGDSFKSKILISVFGKTLDLSNASKKKKDKPVKETTKTEKVKKEKIPLGEKLHKLRVNIERGRYTYLLSKRYVRKKIKIENIDFDLTFGLDDAAHTGIATGAAWGSLYNLFGFISSLCTVKSHKFNITPFFEGECIAFRFDSKVRLRLSNILAIGFAVMINYLKSKRKIKY